MFSSYVVCDCIWLGLLVTVSAVSVICTHLYEDCDQDKFPWWDNKVHPEATTKSFLRISSKQKD